jgi:hypothetical protein
LKRFFAIKGELLLRDAALLADNTRFIRAAAAVSPANLAGFVARRFLHGFTVVSDALPAARS